MPPGRGSSSAFRPFHWIILSGSVKNSNTVAGAAAIRTSRSTMLRSSTCTAFPPFLELGRQRQALQAICPEALHELAQPAQALRPRPVETPGSCPALHDEPGLLQHRQVLGDRRSRDLELGGDLSGDQLCIADELEDAPATRLGDGAYGGFHEPYLSKRLRKKQLTDHACGRIRGERRCESRGRVAGDAGSGSRGESRPPRHHRSRGSTASRPHLLRPGGRRPLLGRRREAEALQAPEAPRQHPRRSPDDGARRPLRGGLDAALVGPAARRGARAREGPGARPRSRAPGRKVRPVSGGAADGPGDRTRRRGVAWLVRGARHLKRGRRSGMKLGIGLPNTMANETDRRLMLDWARLADEAGVELLGTIDKANYDAWDPLVTLAGVAGVTEQAKLATTILQLPNRNEVLVAKQAAVVDRLSGGRLVLGLAQGARPDDYEVLGAPFEGRSRRFEAQIGRIREIWANARESGREHGVVGPAPVPEPPPLWVGAAQEKAIERALRIGDGFLFGTRGSAQMAELTPSLRERAAAEGKPDFTIGGLAYAAIGDDAEKALEEGAHHVLRYYGQLWTEPENLIHHGPAAKIAEEVAAYADAGIDVLVVFPQIPNLDQVEALAEAVLPAYR